VPGRVVLITVRNTLPERLEHTVLALPAPMPRKLTLFILTLP
jgi:hypothetical protein